MKKGAKCAQKNEKMIWVPINFYVHEQQIKREWNILGFNAIYLQKFLRYL